MLRNRLAQLLEMCFGTLLLAYGAETSSDVENTLAAAITTAWSFLNVGEIDLNSTALTVGAEKINRLRKGLVEKGNRVFKRHRWNSLCQSFGRIVPGEVGKKNDNIIIEKQ